LAEGGGSAHCTAWQSANTDRLDAQQLGFGEKCVRSTFDSRCRGHSIDTFDPLRLGATTLANRIVMAPLTRDRAGPGQVPTAMMPPTTGSGRAPG
jgi:hypothetical protein